MANDSNSLLSDLTIEERSIIDVWADTQRSDAARGGSMDKGSWPGWDTVICRRFKDRFGVDFL